MSWKSRPSMRSRTHNQSGRMFKSCAKLFCPCSFVRVVARRPPAWPWQSSGKRRSLISGEGRTLGSIVMWVVFALIIAAAGAWAVTSLINPNSPSAAELERPPDSQVAASKEITGSLPTLCELPPEALLGKRALVHVDLDILDGLGNLTSSADHQIDKVVRTVQYLR